MKLKLLALIFIVGAIVFVSSQSPENRFAQAEDFPRGALVYVQFADLPAAVKLWNESKLKENYLQSENFKQFQNRHLAMKLAERFAEFNNRLGFPIDSEIFASVSETKAAFAVYDIGKMEAVFIAPVSDAVFSASKIFQKQSDFEEIKLDDETIYYRRQIEVDGARQKQKFAFANLKGRFILASNEKLLLQTIAVINGKSANNRLSDEPDFAKLAAKTSPHTLSVWINQAKLNDDYYFKHYWLMPNRAELKKFRAGMFDFEISGEKWTERRQFVLNETAQTSAKINANQWENLRAMLPESVPFYKIQTLENEPQKIAKLLQNAFLERVATENKFSQKSSNWRYFDESDFYGSSNDSDYSYLDGSFDKEIDDGEDGSETKQNAPENEPSFEDSLIKTLAPAYPQISLNATMPQILPAPMFAEFRKVLIFQLRAPKNINRENLENALAGHLKKQLTIGNADAPLNWETKAGNGQTWRELNLPMLGRGIFYALQDDKLIFSNSRELLTEIVVNAIMKIEKQTKNETSFDDLTVIRLDQRADAFDQIMQRIAAEQSPANGTNDFFTGNIGSLLDTAAQVEKIEIRRSQTNEFLNEEVDFVLKQTK